MPLAKGYAAQNCSIARALEVVGERWTLLIVRDEYELTPAGVDLYPVVRALQSWGVAHRAPRGPLRVMLHADDEAPLDASDRCTGCGASVRPEDTLVAPGPGLRRPSRDDDAVTQALRTPHRLLTPLMD